MLDTILIPQLLLYTLASLALGLGVAAVYMYRNTYSKNFVVTLALLPAMVQLVIMMVNGNIGAGVAVMGAFSLVRFRSIPGTAREISCIFFAMAIGLASGMGYPGVGLVFLVLVGAMSVFLNTIPFGEPKKTEKELKITIPENLDYDGIFDDLFQKYTQKAELVRVRTTNLGSLYELHYHIALKDAAINKSFLDELRCRNGNLNIVCGKVPAFREEL
ncbi:MAG: DUF4956 domain-containing protein [Clostridia bacterium]|nr:DUF4956 domain-containing protein [Clostridia bacterium]